MKHLAPLFETPRAAKRLANVYRLLRVSAGSDRLTERDGYEPVLVLLAIGIAFPGLAGDVFREISLEPKATFRMLLTRLDTPPPGPAPPSGEAAVRQKLVASLQRIDAPGLADRKLADFQEWIPVVAEFSFHPWQELLPAATRS